VEHLKNIAISLLKWKKLLGGTDTCEYHLIVHVDDVLRDNDTCDFHSVFGVTLGSCPDVEAALKHFIWVLEDITFDKKNWTDVAQKRC
jgi:hypothetical protein